MNLRSLLYVPAHSERFIGKAHERGADAIILDLEDAVPETDKTAARDNLAATIASVTRKGAAAFVRINAGARQRDDAIAAVRSGVAGLFIPKAGDPNALESLAGTLRAEEARLGRPPTPFVAMVEDPAAMLDARATARVQRVMALSFGAEDFTAVTGGTPTPEVLRFPKLAVHYAAKAEGKLSFGLLQSIAEYSDLEVLAEAAREAKAHGFDGATCIHPSGVAILNAAFAASEAERDWATRVLAAAPTSDAAFSIDGRMVDAPVLARARRILGG
jgi:citrate lyase subunit beta / citryl-CoA lyase